ncbi:hypothetical protein COV14_05900 [Candidatus Woesearchaeota archaeon CG10_big_fil_rev_8_21_14_0_10_33_12]|nr:MAG: hypothetical protein COV14_05900 [Candidatus Woesearchaeota archaeon CG10_big_fil_rev_8_21_14_0_10_33_12]
MGIKEKIEKIMERYEFVTKIKENDSRKLIGTYNDINLYYDPQKEVFELNIDGNYFAPEPDQIREIKGKYLIIM